MPSELETPPRLATDQSRSSEALARKLLGLLRGVTAERRLTPEQRRLLLEWVAEGRGTELGSIGFLIEALQGMVAGGTAALSDFIDIYFALERVLPVTPQRLGQEARRSSLPLPVPLPPVAGEEWSRAETAPLPIADDATQRGWRDDPMTEVQLDFIKRFSGSIAPTASKGEAAHLVDRLLRDQPTSDRQDLLVVFWSHEPAAGDGPREILDWMEALHREDPDRRRAWQLFGREQHAGVRLEELARRAAGAGPAYLTRIRQGEIAVAPDARELRQQPSVDSRRRSDRGRWPVRMLAGVLPILVILALVLIRMNRPKSTASTGVPATEQRAQPETQPATSSTVSARGASPSPIDAVGEAVKALKLVGIVEGREPRAVIDGRTYLVGDLVDIQHGIRVVWIDVGEKTVDFVDANNRIFHRGLR